MYFRVHRYDANWAKSEATVFVSVFGRGLKFAHAHTQTHTHTQGALKSKPGVCVCVCVCVGGCMRLYVGYVRVLGVLYPIPEDRDDLSGASLCQSK